MNYSEFHKNRMRYNINTTNKPNLILLFRYLNWFQIELLLRSYVTNLQLIWLTKPWDPTNPIGTENPMTHYG